MLRLRRTSGRIRHRARCRREGYGPERAVPRRIDRLDQQARQHGEVDVEHDRLAGRGQHRLVRFRFQRTGSGPDRRIGLLLQRADGPALERHADVASALPAHESTNQIAHVNMLTHLINDRALQLISGSGRSFNDAIAQASRSCSWHSSVRCPSRGVAAFSGLNIYNTSTTAVAPVGGNVYLLARCRPRSTSTRRRKRRSSERRPMPSSR